MKKFFILILFIMTQFNNLKAYPFTITNLINTNIVANANALNIHQLVVQLFNRQTIDLPVISFNDYFRIRLTIDGQEYQIQQPTENQMRLLRRFADFIQAPMTGFYLYDKIDDNDQVTYYAELKEIPLDGAIAGHPLVRMLMQV